jgi:hypothetical protein
MKKIFFIIFCLPIILLFHVNIASAQHLKPITGNNLLPEMSDEDVRLLNIFVSNFGELEFGKDNFCFAEINDDVLILFGVLHSYHNNFKNLIKTEDPNKLLIPKKLVDNAADRYFGKKISNHHTIKQLHLLQYNNGNYIFMFGDGDPFYWSNVEEFYDNGNGIFTAFVRNYYSHVLYNEKFLYKRKKYWDLSTCDDWGDTCYYKSPSLWSAIIAPHTYNGKKTYKLVAMKCNS